MKKNKLLIIIAIIFFIICISNFSKAASNDTALKSISIEPSGYELVQDESDNKIYRVKVDNSVTSIKVNAVPNNKDATISVNGNNELAVGTNKVTVSVTAKNGDKSIYTIYVRRASTPIAQENIISNVQDENTEKQNENLTENTQNNKETKIENNSENIVEKNEIKVENTITNNTQINNINDHTENTEKSETSTITGNKNVIIICVILIILAILFFIGLNKKPRGRH